MDIEMNSILVTEIVEPESSNIVAIAYNDVDNSSFVAFKNGTLYQYLDVAREHYESLRDAESVGKHLQCVFIKEGFEYVKLEESGIYVEDETND